MYKNSHLHEKTLNYSSDSDGKRKRYRQNHENYAAMTLPNLRNRADRNPNFIPHNFADRMRPMDRSSSNYSHSSRVNYVGHEVSAHEMTDFLMHRPPERKRHLTRNLKLPENLVVSSKKLVRSVADKSRKPLQQVKISSKIEKLGSYWVYKGRISGRPDGY